MATAKKEELKVLPGFSQGVKPTAAARMITMARPICPNSKITMELDHNGRPVPIKRPSEPNCQLNYEDPHWWETCEAKGHDPYYTTHKWYTTEDIIEDDDSGRLVKKGERMIPHTERVLNTAQVGAALNINNGKGPMEAIERKGFKLLRQMGYDEVCQFRNCQKPIQPEGISRKYGRYCSKEHLSLIGIVADEMVMPVVETHLSGFDTTKAIKKRERLMNEVLLGS